jgi:hypothetical protein
MSLRPSIVVLLSALVAVNVRLSAADLAQRDAILPAGAASGER